MAGGGYSWWASWWRVEGKPGSGTICWILSSFSISSACSDFQQSHEVAGLSIHIHPYLNCSYGQSASQSRQCKAYGLPYNQQWHHMQYTGWSQDPSVYHVDMVERWGVRAASLTFVPKQLQGIWYWWNLWCRREADTSSADAVASSQCLSCK